MSIGAPRISRHVALELLFNVRDLGGYSGRAGQTLRWNRVFRADNLPRATRRDLGALADLGVRTVIDLRTTREVLEEPTPTFPGGPVEYHHLPLLRSTWDHTGPPPRPDADPVAFLAERYLEMLVEGAPMIADALRIMAVPSAQPVIFHCSLGKDRTGLLAAVLLSLLGVRDEVVVEDYALSSLAVAAHAEWSERNHPGGRNGVRPVPAVYLAAPPEAMGRVLAQVRTRGSSMVGFVRSIGVEIETIEALHRHLLV